MSLKPYNNILNELQEINIYKQNSKNEKAPNNFGEVNYKTKTCKLKCEKFFTYLYLKTVNINVLQKMFISWVKSIKCQLVKQINW